MCEHCLGLWTRRRFLKQGVGALLATLLAGCAGATDPGNTTPISATAIGANQGPAAATPTLAPSQRTTAFKAVNLPTVAGTVAEYTTTNLVLASPIGTRSFIVASNVLYQTISGSERPFTDLTIGESVAVQLVDDQVISVQTLPPMAAIDDISNDLVQGAITGEERPLGPLSLITRQGWGAADRQWRPGGESGLYDARSNPGGWLVYPEPLAEQLHTVVVHHSALEFYHGPREVQRLHMIQSRFADVGYHFLIDGLGQLYEGRPVTARGAHTGGYNTGTIGICLLGNFEVVMPTTAQFDTLRQVIEHLRDMYNLTHLGGHRDYQPGATVCPGANCWPLLTDLATSLALTYK